MAGLGPQEEHREFLQAACNPAAEVHHTLEVGAHTMVNRTGAWGDMMTTEVGEYRIAVGVDCRVNRVMMAAVDIPAAVRKM